MISIDKDNIGKGSGRSNPNHNLGNAISQLGKEQLIIKGGGHAKAAGLTVEATKIDLAMDRLNSILLKQEEMNDELSTLNINSVISINAISSDFVEDIDKAGPFGPDSPTPIFVLKNCKIKWCKLLNISISNFIFMMKVIEKFSQYFSEH